MPENGQTDNGQTGNAAGTEGGTIFTEPTPGIEHGAKTVANMLGEITWLMSQSANHKNFFISDLEWMVMAPILRRASLKSLYFDGLRVILKFRVPDNILIYLRNAETKNCFRDAKEGFLEVPSKQYRVFYARDRPIGCMMWAFADEEVATRLAAGNARLKPQDWKSGDALWVVDIIAPYGGQDEMLKDLKEKVFADREVKFLAVVDGKMVVRGM